MATLLKVLNNLPIPNRRGVLHFASELREGHSCYVCHEESNNAFRLEKLPAGAAFWTEEQSRKNFDTVSVLVMPGDPAHSRLLLQPLAPEEGGTTFHSGGRQFTSKSDPDWETLAQWVIGRTAQKE
jgi:hypothetical protein